MRSKAKLNLTQLEVYSFVTEMGERERKTIAGGAYLTQLGICDLTQTGCCDKGRTYALKTFYPNDIGCF